MTDELYLAGLSKRHTQSMSVGSIQGPVQGLSSMFGHSSTTKVRPMTSTAPLTSAHLTLTSVAYVESDIPDGQTLVDWRRELDAARRRVDAAQRAERRRRRSFGLPRLPLLRPAW
jgi:hypothetical protein